MENGTNMNKILKTLENVEYGIEVTIRANHKGYAVKLRDTDADEYLPEIRIYPTLDAAIQYAEKLVA